METNPIKAWRSKHQLSQKQTAKLIGVKAMTLSRWERGGHFPHKRHWQAIEDATGIPASELVVHAKQSEAA